jgi:hypothetical protein
MIALLIGSFEAKMIAHLTLRVNRGIEPLPARSNKLTYVISDMSRMRATTGTPTEVSPHPCLPLTCPDLLLQRNRDRVWQPTATGA